MGLDQYLEADGEEIGYWRKHPDLHCHIEALWRAAHPDGDWDSFNCVEQELTEDDINEIIRCSEERSFGEHDGSTGFFFGSTDEYHHEATIPIMKRALELCQQGKKITYTSSW